MKHSRASMKPALLYVALLPRCTRRPHHDYMRAPDAVSMPTTMPPQANCQGCLPQLCSIAESLAIGTRS